MTPTQIRAQSGPWLRDIQLYIGNRDHRVKDIILESITSDESNTVEQPPSFIIERKVAQILMDDLWHCGLRPTEGTGSAGSLRATERHLADMRAIAFAKLNTPSPDHL